MLYFKPLSSTCLVTCAASLGASRTYPRPQKNVVGKLGLSLGRGKTMFEQELFVPIKLSGRALNDDGQMINSNVINHVTKERLG